MADRVSIGIPAYGQQDKDFWGPLVKQAAELHKQDIELVDLLVMGSMMTDVSRNYIVKDFLETNSEWLQWIDADNIHKIGSIRRLLDTKKTLVTGVYTKRNDKGDIVAYFATGEGEYEPVQGFTSGEIFPVDSAGMGACLVHRSVFEDIKRNYSLFDMTIGGVIAVHNLDITGDVFDDTLNPTDNRVTDGQFRIRLRQPTKQKAFPFFMLGFGRTEDYGFYEMAARSGHKLWLDTSVEIGHLGTKVFGMDNVRKDNVEHLLLKGALP